MYEASDVEVASVAGGVELVLRGGYSADTLQRRYERVEFDRGAVAKLIEKLNDWIVATGRSVT